MVRKPRVEFEEAFYDVIVRGNQRQKVCRDGRDRSAYLERLEHYRERYGFDVYDCVLMSNHVHLLVETKKVLLSRVMPDPLDGGSLIRRDLRETRSGEGVHFFRLRKLFIWKYPVLY